MRRVPGEGRSGPGCSSRPRAAPAAAAAQLDRMRRQAWGVRPASASAAVVNRPARGPGEAVVARGGGGGGRRAGGALVPGVAAEVVGGVYGYGRRHGGV